MMANRWGQVIFLGRLDHRTDTALIQTPTLRVIRYIELNPVRATMVERPDHYRWASVHTHLGTAQDPLLTPHPVYLALAADRPCRAAAWYRWLNTPLDPEEIARIRAYMAQGHAASTVSKRWWRKL